MGVEIHLPISKVAFDFSKCVTLYHFVSQGNNNNQKASVLGISTPVFLGSSYFDMDPNFAPEAQT